MNERINPTVMLCVAEAKDAIQASKETSLAKQLKVAMRNTRKSWCITNEEEQFKAAVVAVMSLQDEDGKARLVEEFKALQRFGAMIAAAAVGLSVDLASVLSDVPEDKDRWVGLMKIWNESKEE
jgi:hypothetical protein